ncbi:MAG: DUF4303 domain-containing protein, partial [Bacteroides sp.]|nr:DUF4303 domain-containing protein [Bacteroides sp.]
RQTHEIGRLRGFAFYTDESFMSLSVFIDTRQEIKGNADEASYYRFAVDEWNDEGYPNDKLASVNDILVNNDNTDMNDLDSFFSGCRLYPWIV